MARAARRSRETPSSLGRDLMEQLMFGSGRVRRFTQDTPVLPDVWLEYARGPADPRDPHPPVKLLLTPFREAAAGDVSRVLRERLAAERRTAAWRAFGHDAGRAARVIYNQSTAAATLYFEDLVRVVLPMTDWWDRVTRTWNPAEIRTPAAQRALAEAVKNPEHAPVDQQGRRLSPDMLWLLRVVGAVALACRGRPLPAVFTDPRRGVAAATERDWLPLVQAVAAMIDGISPAPPRPRIYSVSLNREAAPTVSRSTLAVKADAARRLFNISCGDLSWAIIDSGIDAQHPAFRAR